MNSSRLRTIQVSVCMSAVVLLVAGCGGGSGGSPLFTVGGTVSGHAGTNLILQNNGGNDLIAPPGSANGAFTFSERIATGIAYAVTVLTQPSGQTCVVSNGSGTMGTANVTNVAVNCTNTFAVSGSMVTARYDHTATLLPNNKVLLAGGATGLSFSTSLASAEIFDPDTASFAGTGSMATPRYDHTTTLLPSGKVLITGGYFAGTGVLANAELYDPATGLFTATGSMGTARARHTATLLLNGKVLVAGGATAAFYAAGGGSHFASAEIYDPATGFFSATGSMANARAEFTATLLLNGQVLVAGGEQGASGLASAELFSTTGFFTATGSMLNARYVHTATLLPNGNVMLAGGADTSAAALASAELYDPAAGLFTTTGSLGTARYIEPATLLPNGQVLLTGGSPDGTNFLTSAEIYDSVTALFTASVNLATGRYYHTGTLLPNGQVLVAGGYGATGTIASAELLQ